MTLTVVAVGLEDLSNHGVELIFDLPHSGLHGKLVVMNLGLKLSNSFSLLLLLLCARRSPLLHLCELGQASFKTSV
jgi:hypothetical protein